MRTPVHGGTRRVSYNNKVYQPNYTESMNKPEDNSVNYLESIDKLPTGFKRGSQQDITRRNTRKIRALRELTKAQNNIDVTNLQQAGQTEREQLSNIGAMDRTLINNDIKNKEFALDQQELNIDRMKAETDADYKNYLKNNNSNKGKFTEAQWFTHDQNYRAAYDKKYKDPTAISDNDFMDADGTNPIDYKMAIYRDNPMAAQRLYGEPDARTKALIGLNIDPEAWKTYVSKSPEEQEYILNNIIQQMEGN
jgi:hypothetical protein